jgi:hypothetical protein
LNSETGFWEFDATKVTEETIENYAFVSENSMYGQDYMNLVKKWGAKECFVL